MGNCLKTVASHDDISLLRDSAPTAQRESSDQSIVGTAAANILTMGGINLGGISGHHGHGHGQTAQTHFVSTSDPHQPPHQLHHHHSTSSSQQHQQRSMGIIGHVMASQENNSGTLFYPSPNVSRQASQLTEEEQVKIAQRIGLIQHLPTGSYDGCKKNRECVICMIEFLIDDPIRFLPCMHIYHTKCIDDWLMRSFTCPSCMEPVDAALLSTYQTD